MVLQLPLFVLALAFATIPTSVTAALFPKKSSVKHIDAKAFRKALKENRTFVTAFVAPWCGHCQKLAPELVRAADGLHPLVPVYAIDCDDNQNKPLCAEQEVKGFPTIKLFPRGKKVPPLEFDGTRTASSLFYWASRAVPSTISRTQTAKGIADIVAKNPGKPKAVLMNKSNKTPLLWKVLSNKYSNNIVFGNCRDRKGKISVEMGFEAGDQSKPKVLVYGPDDKEPILYEGILKFAALSEFFDQVIEGSIEISHASLNAKQKVLKTPESERKALDDETRIGDAGYGGFNPHEGLDMEQLLKHGVNPHASGHPGASNPQAAGASDPHVAGQPASAAHNSSSPNSTASPSTPESQPSKAEILSESDVKLTSVTKDTTTSACPAAVEEPSKAVGYSVEPATESAEHTKQTKDEL